MKLHLPPPRSIFALSVAAALAAVSPPGQADTTYFIDESTDFTGNGCQNDDLNTVTATLQTALSSAGWSGSRYCNDQAWPQDFMESCSTNYGSGGLDDYYGDNALFSVYAGHGNKGLLQWGYMRNGVCTVDFSANMRMGSMGGFMSGYAAYITSCTLNTSSLVGEANWQWENQQFGYHNSPWVKDDQPRDFFNGTTGTTNRWSWVNNMEDRPYWFTGDNSPIAVSYGATASECTNIQNTAKLKGQLSTFPRWYYQSGPSCNQGQPPFFYCYYIYDNGGC